MTELEKQPVAERSLRFTRVRLGNWRNFGEVDVSLPRRVFLVGPNASGKSNFLDAFRFLQEIASVGGGFQKAVADRRGVSSLRCLAAKRNPDIVLAVSIGTEERPNEWEYELHFTQVNRKPPAIRKERIAHAGEEVLLRPTADDRSDLARLTQTHLEQLNVNQPFREVWEFLRSVRYLHIVPQLVRDPDRYRGAANDPYGGDFLEQVAGTPERTQKARLRPICEALRVAVPQLREIQLRRDRRKGTPHLRGRYEHWRFHGAWQTEKEFSDGTLRLMGLLWAALDGSGPLLLEEPELSLHAEVVRFIPPMFARIQRRTGRQVVISTHSADLLRDEGIGLDEVFLLKPGPEGTSVQPSSGIVEIEALLEGGLSLPEAVLPHTRPETAEQLSLFGDL